MIKLLSKLGMSSGVVSGACLVNFSLETIPATSDKKEIEKIKASVDNITTKEGIELFEKANGCSFAFVGRWEHKEVYTFKKFLKEQTNPESWEQKVIDGAKDLKDRCKSKGTVALFHNNSTSKFQLDHSKLPAQ